MNGSLTSTSTPPSASVRPLKPSKSIITVWSMCAPSRDSTVCTVSGDPPESQPGVDLGRPVAGNVHPEVAHDRDAVDPLPVGGDVDQHDGVRALVGRRPRDGLGFLLAGIAAAVAAQQQDVERDGGRFRRFARRGGGGGRRSGCFCRRGGLGLRPVEEVHGGNDGEHQQARHDRRDQDQPAALVPGCRGWLRQLLLDPAGHP